MRCSSQNSHKRKTCKKHPYWSSGSLVDLDYFLVFFLFAATEWKQQKRRCELRCFTLCNRVKIQYKWYVIIHTQFYHQSDTTLNRFWYRGSSLGKRLHITTKRRDIAAGFNLFLCNSVAWSRFTFVVSIGNNHIRSSNLKFVDHTYSMFRI